MSIAEKVTRLITAHEDIITALTNKGVTATGHGFEDFADDIGSISSGGGLGELLATESLGTISTSSTSASGTDLNKTISVQNAGNYEALIVLVYNTSPAAGDHIGTAFIIYLNKQAGNKAGDRYKITAGQVSSHKENLKLNDNGFPWTGASSTAYGIYCKTITVDSNGTDISIGLFGKYSYSFTGTINGNYKINIYGIGILDIIGNFL